MSGVLGDLRLQRVEPGEFALRPDEIDQRHPQMAPIKIDVGVEEMRLEPGHQTAYGWAQTEIGDTVHGMAGERIIGTVAADAYGIDAEGRVQIVVETEIRRRKADRPPAPVAGGDAAVDLPEPAEQGRRLPRLPGFPVRQQSSSLA